MHDAPQLGFGPERCSADTIRQSVSLMRMTAIVFLAAGIVIKVVFLYITQ
jgi:cobalamin biosynthesis protein CobD/CbiB